MFSIFCNYLRGVEQTSIRTNRPFKEKLKLFFKFFKRLSIIIKLLFPKFKCVSVLLLFILLVDVVALEYVVYQVGLLSGKYFKILSNKDLGGFRDLALFSIGMIVVNSVMKSLKDFIAKLLQIVWRKYLTLKLHDFYFLNKNYYYLQNPNFNLEKSKLNDSIITLSHFASSNANHAQQLSNNKVEPVLDRVKNRKNGEQILVPSNNICSESNVLNSEIIFIPESTSSINNPKNSEPILDNPDQRITQDVNSLCESISNILPLIIVTPFVIGWYGYQTWITVGYSGPLTVFVYFVIWGLMNGPLTSPIASVIYKQDKREGDFRFKHMNLRTNAESIAFYDSSNNELNQINQNFTGLLSISYRRNWKELILKIFINTSQYMGGILAYLVLAVPIFTNVYDNYTPTDLSQLISNYSFKCQYLIYLFTQLYDMLTEISVIAGNSHRIGELIETMKENHKNHNLNLNKNYKLDENVSEDKCFILNDVTITLPSQSKTLIKNLNLEFIKNRNILLSGRSGCGKTSLFRCINGLWKCFTGEIIMNKNETRNLFYLPQNSYFTSGSILDQIVYPSSTDELKALGEPYQAEKINEINEWFKVLNLEHLLEKVSFDLNKTPSFNWTTILSAGMLVNNFNKIFKCSLYVYDF